MCLILNGTLLGSGIGVNGYEVKTGINGEKVLVETTQEIQTRLYQDYGISMPIYDDEYGLNAWSFSNCVDKEVSDNPQISSYELETVCTDYVSGLIETRESVKTGMDQMTDAFNNLEKEPDYKMDDNPEEADDHYYYDYEYDANNNNEDMSTTDLLRLDK